MSGPLDRTIEMMLLTEIKRLRTELATARDAERERCVKVCRDIVQARAEFPGPERGPQAWRASSEADGAEACANAILALSDEGET